MRTENRLNVISQKILDEGFDLLFLARHIAARINEISSALQSHVVIESDDTELTDVLVLIQKTIVSQYEGLSYADFNNILLQYNLTMVIQSDGIAFIDNNIVKDNNNDGIAVAITGDVLLNRFSHNALEKYRSFKRNYLL